MDNLSKPVGDRLKSIRKSQGLTQEQVSDGICTKQALSQIENGKLVATDELLVKLCHRLGVHVQVLDDNYDRYQLAEMIVFINRQEWQLAFEIAVRYVDRTDVSVESSFQIAKAMSFYNVYIVRDLEQSVSHINEFLQRCSHLELKTKAYNLLGTVYRMFQDWIEAYTCYRKAYDLCLQYLRLTPVFADVSYNLGVVCHLLGRDDEAQLYLKYSAEFYEKAMSKKFQADAVFELGKVKRDSVLLLKAAELYSELQSEIHSLLVRSHYAFHVLSKTDKKQAIHVLQDVMKEYEKYCNKGLVLNTLTRIVILATEISDITCIALYMDIANTFDFLQIESKYVHYYNLAIAKYYFTVGNFEDALDLGHKTMVEFDKMGMTSEFRDCAILCAKTSKALSKMDQAIFYYEKIHNKELMT